MLRGPKVNTRTLYMMLYVGTPETASQKVIEPSAGLAG